MKLSILLRTTEYRGDHSAAVVVAHEPWPGETVEQLAERLLAGHEVHATDWIEIPAPSWNRR